MGKVGLRSTCALKSMTCIHSASAKSESERFNVREGEKRDFSLCRATDFAQMLTAGCNRFLDDCYKVIVKRDDRSDEYLKYLKRHHKKSRPCLSTRRTLVSSSSSKDILDPKQTPGESVTKTIGDEIIVVNAVYDNSDKLCEIHLNKQKHVMRELMQILGLVTPHFPQCIKLSLKNSHINGCTIHEMRKFLPLTAITEVCLDGCPLRESTYSLLLEHSSRITTLSLCRCEIQDDECAKLASKLHFSEAAERTLSVLNLSSNHITDVGATSIGEALRTNRHLRYLNLADNCIGDDGADRILQPLIDFPLTYDETMVRQRNYFDFLRAKQFHTDHESDWDSKSMTNTSSFKPAKKGLKLRIEKSKAVPLDDVILRRTEMTANENVGKVNHPFMPPSTKLVDGWLHCTGNMILCYLNLSYNELSYLTVKRIHYVVLEQSKDNKLGRTGLLKVVIDGNPIPISCDELDHIGDMLQKNIVQLSHKSYGSEKRIHTSRVSTNSEKIRE